MSTERAIEPVSIAFRCQLVWSRCENGHFTTGDRGKDSLVVRTFARRACRSRPTTSKNANGLCATSPGPDARKGETSRAHALPMLSTVFAERLRGGKRVINVFWRNSMSNTYFRLATIAATCVSLAGGIAVAQTSGTAPSGTTGSTATPPVDAGTPNRTDSSTTRNAPAPNAGTSTGRSSTAADPARRSTDMNGGNTGTSGGTSSATDPSSSSGRTPSGSGTSSGMSRDPSTMSGSNGVNADGTRRARSDRN